MKRLLPCALALAACSDPGPTTSPPDLAIAQSGPPGLDLSGRYALALELDVTSETLGGDGGATSQAGKLPLYLVWSSFQNAGKLDVHVKWELCDLPLAGLGDADERVLGSTLPQTDNGALASRMDGARFDQQSVVFLLGAKLTDPVKGALPTDGNVICGPNIATDCATLDSLGHLPGVPLPVHGLMPNVAFLYIDLRVVFAFTGAAHTDGTLAGTVTSASIESHVLGCQTEAGTNCSAADVAKLEASHPRIQVSGGTLRAHAQNAYFTCPQFLTDPVAGITGMEAPDGGLYTDGGVTSDGGAVADAAAQQGPEPSAGSWSFERDIQPDLDARGCATGGCHEAMVEPTQMRLYFKPGRAAERLANYAAVLPFIGSSDGTEAGGRFVNTVPIPAPMRARWLSWIAAGAPY